MAKCNALRNIQHYEIFMTNEILDIWLHPGIDNEKQASNLSLLQRLNVAIDMASIIDYLHNQLFIVI